jgi:Flp pilus assembly protein TadG
MVEFALILPLLLLLLIGIVEFARAWNVYEVLTDAAREGARNAVVDNPSTADPNVIKTLIQEAGARAGITIAPGDISFPDGFRTGRGQPTTVRIQHQHELTFLGALLGLLTGDRNLNMVTEFVMRNE